VNNCSLDDVDLPMLYSINNNMKKLKNGMNIMDIEKGIINSVSLESGREAALFWVNDTLIAFDSTCPHMGADLCGGYHGGSLLICPWHGYEFDINSGDIVRNPNIETMAKIRVRSDTFDPACKVEYKLKKLKVLIRNNQFYIEER